MIDITPGMKICDPACGVGKFLLEPILHDLHRFYKVEDGELHLTAQRLFQAKKITGVTVTACMRMMATASLFTTEAWDICTLNTFPCFP